MNKHTPGPWKAPKPTIGDSNCLYIGEKTGNWDICVINTTTAPTPKQAKANARLIAAAPDLLEALEQLTAVCNYQYKGTAAYNQALEAVRKATRY